jgi:membrane associated rhomboid family serine protease
MKMGTLLIFIINAAVFWYINISHSDNDNDPVVWITNAFIHGGWSHIIMNMLALLEIGFSTEKITNTFWFFVVYLVSMLGADLANYYYLQEHVNVYVIGASGAIFGLYAFYSLIARQFKDFIVFALIYNGAVYLMHLNIAWFGHAGGAVAGFLVGAVYLMLNCGYADKN